MMRLTGPCAAALLLAGCASTGSGSKPGGPVLPSAATFSYGIPETTVKVATEVLIVSCATGDARVKIDPKIGVTATPSGKIYRLNGKDLTGTWSSHDLSITKYDTGAIKTINSADSNRTFAVIGNVLKGLISGATIFGFVEGAQQPRPPPPTGLNCSGEASTAATAVDALKAKILSAQQELRTTADTKKAADLAVAISAYAGDVARLTTTKPLFFTLPAKTVPLNKASDAIVYSDDDIPSGSIASAGRGAAFQLAYCLDAIGTVDPETACAALQPSEKAKAYTLTTPPDDCGDDKGCTHSIVMREPKRAMLTLVGVGSAYRGETKPLKAATFPAAQWGEFSVLSFKVGLGQSRTANFSLDEYGGKTTFAWKSDARAESITGGVAGALDSTATLATKLRGADLADKKAEIDELQTEQKLNQLRACKAILDAGGFVCPTS